MASDVAARFESLGNYGYYWIEAEDFVERDLRYGKWENRNKWTRRRNGLANDSGDHSLISPIDRSNEVLIGNISSIKSGNYNLWARIGSFAQWPQQGFLLSLNDAQYSVVPKEKGRFIEKSFVWVKVGGNSTFVDGSVSLGIQMDLSANRSAVLDCLLLTDDLDYMPPSDLPRCGYFGVLPYRGSQILVDFWHPAKLDTPIYVCKGAAQHFLLRIRNLSDRSADNFTVSLRLPRGITVVDPSRRERWEGDGEKFKSPHFVSLSPDEFTSKVDRRFDGEFGIFDLHYVRRSVRPYDIYAKAECLLFITLDVSNDINCGDGYTAGARALDSNGEGVGQEIEQRISVLPGLGGPYATNCQWGVDAIYFSFLSQKEQCGILDTFRRSSVNTWASRAREGSPCLASRNRESWSLARNAGLKVVNWSEWFWPGSPHANESLEYIKRHPEALGVSRDDDRGKSLSGKLICPTFLLSGEKDCYITKHMEGVINVLRDNDIESYIEDVEYSSPLSFCFCGRCLDAFSVGHKVKRSILGGLTPDQIIEKYGRQWIEFRCAQNTSLVKKISDVSHVLYPEINFNIFCGYPSPSVRRRYGVEWSAIVGIESVDGVYVGGGMPGTPGQITEMQQMTRLNNKSFVSMANATLSFPHGFDELTFRNPAYMEARIIHDIMCGSRGMFIWWWGTLDGRCMKAFELGASIVHSYDYILNSGTRSYRKIGVTNDFYLIKCISSDGSLVCVANPSRFTDDMVVDRDLLAADFPVGSRIINVMTGLDETREMAMATAGSIYRKGQVSLWFVSAR